MKLILNLENVENVLRKLQTIEPAGLIRTKPKRVFNSTSGRESEFTVTSMKVVLR
jgi:hypothetical protein